MNEEEVSNGTSLLYVNCMLKKGKEARRYFKASIQILLKNLEMKVKKILGNHNGPKS